MKRIIAAAILIGLTQSALANGWYESRPWQFDTTADKANKAAVLDMIERKKGGYYDGFSTTINNNSTTNVGTQINCNNLASAIGNEATNGQSANSPSVSNDSDTNSSANGNVADNGAGHGGGDIGNDQGNSGDVSSGITGSTSSSSGPINGGPSDQALNNTQDNSGNQTATLTDSTACDMTGTIRGNVKSNVSGPLN
jgi:hypothetical protein